MVTGASSGIGRAAALRLDRRGWRVFAGVRREEDADALRRAASERLRPLFLDVTDEAQVADAATAVETATGEPGLDALVNNAGVAMGGPLEFLPIDAFRRQLEVNVVGQLAITQALMPAIRRASGRIVNIGSISGRSTVPLVGAYAASKHALEAMTDALRMELRPWNIEVVIVEPGAVRTDIWRRSIERAERMGERMPEHARELYGRLIAGVRRRSEGASERGIAADRVADVIEHALSARRPKTRYLVGRDARIRAWLQRLPDRWRDRIIGARLKRLARDAARETR